MSKQEKFIIIFLVGCIIAGCAVSFYKKTHQTQIEIAPSGVIKASASWEKQISLSSIININIADEKQLCSLKGIGPGLAKDIVEYRDANGPFIFPEDIAKVRGIGKAKYENIKNFITTKD